MSASFNQDNSCFSVGLDSGFCVFNSEPCQLKVSRDLNGGIAIAEMIGRANYMALVGGGEQPKFPPNKIVIWDDAKQEVAFTLDFRTLVHRVRLSRSRIVVVLRDSVNVYAFSSPPEKLSSFKTADNPLGLCCLGSQLLAFPGRTAGQVQLVELARGNVSIIPAHSSPLRALELSADGEFLATASATGTLIRVYSTINYACIAELRRGIDAAVIFDLAISPSSRYIAVTSDKSTLHIFDLPGSIQERASRSSTPDRQRGVAKGVSSGGSRTDENGSQKWGILGKLPMMPRVFSDTYSFASSPFEIGTDEQQTSTAARKGTTSSTPTGIPDGNPSKGVIGWTSDKSLVVIGAGREGRWERFAITEVPTTGHRVCVRDGWRKYLGGG